MSSNNNVDSTNLDSDYESSESSFDEEEQHNILDESDDDEIFPGGSGRRAGVVAVPPSKSNNKDDHLHDSNESLFRDDDESALQVEDYEDDDNASEAQDGFDNSSYRNYGDDSSFVSHAVALGPSSGGSVCSLSQDGGRRLNLTRQFSTGSIGSIGSLESLDSCAMSTGGYSSEEEGDEDFVIAVNWTPKNVKGKIGKLPGFGGGDNNNDDASLDGIGSCASIKDILPIDRISEDKPSANAQVTVVAAQFDENGELVDKPQMNGLLSKIVQSTQNMDMTGGEEDGDGEEEGGNVPKLVSKKGPGFTSSLSKKKKTSSSSDDPLLSKFLNSKKEKSKQAKKSTRGRRGLGGQISHILGSTDSLDHMKFSRNKRVVKTTTRKQPAKPDVEDASVTGEETDGDEDDELEDLAAALLAA